MISPYVREIRDGIVATHDVADPLTVDVQALAAAALAQDPAVRWVNVSLVSDISRGLEIHQSHIAYRDTEAELDVILVGAYTCDREWSAWGCDTMTEDDFTPAGETEVRGELLALINKAVAGELDRMAAETEADAAAAYMGVESGTLHGQAARLRARAAELRGEQS